MTETTSQMTVDPVCGMTVNPDSAAGSYDYKGQSYYFCHAHCLNKFRQEPERYLNGSPASPIVSLRRDQPVARHDSYTCPMHPEVSGSGPRSCPKCEMSLERSLTTPQQKTEYTCPMHPEIVSDKPGTCPICGMALEPRTFSLADEVNPELVAMTRRFWICVVLTIPLLLIGMSDVIPGASLKMVASMRSWSWLELLLATPVVL